MARYQVILAYDGTHFAGYQRQARARTVQGVFEEALRAIGWSGSSILSAGRTDTGVHAVGQVVAFDLDWQHSPQELRQALNAHLPADTAAREVCPAAAGFHPRYDARSRSYRYRLFCQDTRDPLRERYAWRVWPAVDLALLRGAAQIWIGTHDFAAYGTPPRPGGSTLRTIFQAEWSDADGELNFRVTGNAFLYRMVRRLVYAQVQVGQNRLQVEDLRQALQTGKGLPAGLAPAHGLALTAVTYEPPMAENNQENTADLKNALASSGENDRGQDFRP